MDLDSELGRIFEQGRNLGILQARIAIAQAMLNNTGYRTENNWAAAVLSMPIPSKTAIEENIPPEEPPKELPEDYLSRPETQDYLKDV